ncbi:neuromedin-U isoform X2 [Ascaphus truei]|uniref:neuromedin-U isoform X2 n=1 Tax=Ascaphus truei TaxID=8439 RepID=UPI003F593772
MEVLVMTLVWAMRALRTSAWFLAATWSAAIKVRRTPSRSQKSRSAGCRDRGAPLSSKALRAEQELQLWNGIDDACSAILSDSQPVASSALEELCFMVMGILQKSQGSDEKETTKRFLFHYSKSHDSGNSGIMSSVLHPLLQLVPQLHDRRMKRFKADEEVQGPGGVLSRGYFLFRPRNGRRAAGFR